MNNPVKRVTVTLDNGEVITVSGRGRLNVYTDKIDGKPCEIAIVHLVIAPHSEPVPSSQNQPQDSSGGE